MNHRVSGRKLSRSVSHRKALLRNLSDALIRYGSISTTISKAKELRKIAERLVTLAKRDTLHSKRAAASWLRTDEAFKKLFSEYKDLFKERNGGYTRIVKMGARKGDAAPMAYIEYIKESKETSTKTTSTRKRRRSKKSSAEKTTAVEKTETAEA
jgi:large subunit ribosomal protein L17